jgi:hypothetical protein
MVLPSTSHGRESEHKDIGCVDARYAVESQLLHQAILESLIRPFDVTFGRRCVGADPIDVELVGE